MEKFERLFLADFAPGRLSAHRFCSGAGQMGTRCSSRLAAQSRVLCGPEPQRVLSASASAASVYFEAVATDCFHSQFHPWHAGEWEAESDSACCPLCPFSA